MLRKYSLALLSVCAVGLLASPNALASGEGPGWMLVAHSLPTYLPPGGQGAIVVDVYNVGAKASSGAITVTDTLPRGVTATEAGGISSVLNRQLPEVESEQWACTGNAPGESPRAAGKFQPATVVTCHNMFSEFPGGGGTPTGDSSTGPNLQPRIAVIVSAAGETVSPAQAQAEPNHVTIVGGGAPAPASSTNPEPISSATPPFGFMNWNTWFSNADGTLDTQAGSHPYEATFTFNMNQVLGIETIARDAGGEPRDLEVRLPPGLLINPLAVPQCTRAQLLGYDCPKASMVGTLTPQEGGHGGEGFAVFNMVPPPGVPGEVGFNFEGIRTLLDGSVRSGSDYGITVDVRSIVQRYINGAITTLWNVPGEASHAIWSNGFNGGCSPTELEQHQFGCELQTHPLSTPYLTLATSCGTPPATTIRGDTWQTNPVTGRPFEAEASSPMVDSSGEPAQITGCEQLGFAPSISTSPDTADSDTPAGLTVEVRPPVGGLEEQSGLSTSDIEDTTVALPAGLVINPGQAAGLQACTPAQAALENLPSGEENDGPAQCPNASKVGTFIIKTPLIEQAEEKQFEGSVYVLQSNPPNIELLVAGSADGVNLKLVGDASLCEQAGQEIDGKRCEAPGQLITKFAHTPELPFTAFKLSFSGGAQAALDTPAQCGTYTSNADFVSWSSPFIPDFLTSASFGITAGPGGGACPSSPMPFSPSMVAGPTTVQAGAFTDFSLLLQRGDGQQRIEKLSFKVPSGLSGMISQVTPCDEADANAGTCPASSHIGHAVVASGPGPYPLVIPQPGDPELPIYLTGPYKGAPFGLSIVTHVIAGPFDLGTIVTRAKIEVDPHTAQITITTDPLPQIVDGVPTDLRSINAVIDRPNFMFNPTNCNSAEFTGTATSTGGAASAPLATHMGLSSCRELEFKPKFTVSTSRNASRLNGASLTAKLSYPDAAQGTQANITRVKVDLPKQLPSRLTTLQKACTSAQFEANPAGCPAASKIGYATVHTPLLPVAVSGPVIFVSHGGEAFPSLTMVLQGDGVMVDLVGTTFISKAGITSTTFKTVPDVPFSTFELTLPQGPYSALAANLSAKAAGSFCGQNLKMPTELTAQNGLKISESTKIAVTGCPRAKKAHKRSQHRHGRSGKRHKRK